MNKNNLVKNVVILLDFIVSIVASAIKDMLPGMSNILFMISAVILFIAVVCVIVDFVSSGKSVDR